MTITNSCVKKEDILESHLNGFQKYPLSYNCLIPADLQQLLLPS